MARIAVIQKDKCNPEKCGWLCIKLCPVNRTGQDCIIKSEDNKPIIDEILCTGCGICSNRCPFDAISIINLPEELDRPIHRYGKNGFALYSLPTPLFGRLTGIIGVNGIGKTTAIRILAKAIRPNLGKESEADYKEIIEFFKGTENQLFFEKLDKGEIKVAYKPQNVELITKQVSGKIKSLLEKVDEKNMLEKVSERVGIKDILDNDITKLSGGELQRVAIAATALKKSSLYIFDEPTSYLDIKQRLNIAKFIRSLIDENTAVVVIEHDLVALDYMADIINIMYGKRECYGIVSTAKPAKAGINSYLEGYIKEDNVRFRDKKIIFEIRPPEEAEEKEELVEWTEMEKTKGRFSLKIKEGSLRKNEVIGILGENAVGKTTFMNILAGKEKPDRGEIKEKPKVAYKEQYIFSYLAKPEPVASVLSRAVSEYNNLLVKPLKLDSLMQKNLDELSGGELQKVAIAKALSEEADIVLLDEPSAYLDVELRLIAAKTIKNIAEKTKKTIVVVDHDLFFIDAIASRLIVFSGTPAKKGIASGPDSMENGMNLLLKEAAITLRRDPTTGRPRINKPGSQKDMLQKKSGKYYYQ